MHVHIRQPKYDRKFTAVSLDIKRLSREILWNVSAGLCLEEVSHTPPMLPTLLRDPAVPLDDDVDDFLLDGVDVHDLYLAVFEAEDEVSSTDIPGRHLTTLTAFLNVNLSSHKFY